MQPDLFRKEGFAEGSINAVVMLIAGVAVATMVLIFVGSLGGQVYEQQEPTLNAIGNTPVGNQSLLVDNTTAQYLGHSSIHNSSFVVYANATPSNVLPVNVDYSLDSLNGYFTLLNGVYNGTTLNMNYSYGSIEIQNSVKQAAISGFEGLSQTGNYLPIVVLAIIITLVLGIILTSGLGSGFNIGGRGGTAL